jgi:glycosyltransferase involved in cell wall biosynthesis
VADRPGPRPHSRSDARPRILFLTKYGRRAATTRFRVLQYLPYLEQAGFSCELRPLLNDAYLQRTLEEGKSAWTHAATGVARRLAALLSLHRYSLVVIHMEAIPFFPPIVERAVAAMGVPYVYDFDDASFHKYDQHDSAMVRVLSAKISVVIKHASLVTAGNPYLAEYAKQFNSNVQIFPTIVDTDVFAPPAQKQPQSPVVIGWIGSPTTAPYVAELADIWQAVTADGGCVLRLVGSGDAIPPTNGIEVRPWAEDTEVSEIQQFDVGIMPLSEDPWARGKSGFKLIEYLACGLPAVASPVGVNADIVIDGHNGYLCRSWSEWIGRLRGLVEDSSAREAMGRRGRQLAIERWSLKQWGPRLAEAFAAVARGRLMAV